MIMSDAAATDIVVSARQDIRRASGFRVFFDS
jgi:hypothetical protein